MNKLQLSEPMYYNYSQGYSSRSVSITPYDRGDMQNILSSLSIKTPFTEVIDRSMGKSTCLNCGSVYAGEQIKCEHYDFFYNSSSSYHKSNKKDPKTLSSYPMIEGSWEVCGNDCVWDLSKQFSDQKTFFSDMTTLYDIANDYDLTFSPALKYKDIMFPGGAEALEKKAMINLIIRLDAELDSVKQAITTIAEKINSAGHSLSF